MKVSSRFISLVTRLTRAVTITRSMKTHVPLVIQSPVRMTPWSVILFRFFAWLPGHSSQFLTACFTGWNLFAYDDSSPPPPPRLSLSLPFSGLRDHNDLDRPVKTMNMTKNATNRKSWRSCFNFRNASKYLGFWMNQGPCGQVSSKEISISFLCTPQ